MSRARPPTIRLLVLGLLAASLAGSVDCLAQSPRERVTVWASWTDAPERPAFQRVLQAFEDETGIHADFTATRALNDLLIASVQSGTQPDVAVSGQGDLAAFQQSGHLHPLDHVIQGGDLADYDPQWLLRLGGPKDSSHVYAVPIKANLKSIVWFDPKRQVVDAASPPRTWIQLAGAFASKGSSAWCMGLEDVPNSGWPGADWIEDALLRLSGHDVYQHWAAGELKWTSPEVRSAWTFLRELVANSVRGRASGALLTDFRHAGSPMFASPPGCYLEHQGSFITGFYQNSTPGLKAGADFDFFPLPGFDGLPDFNHGDRDRLVVQPDLAAMFNDTRPAERLMQFLATPRAQAIWPGIKGGGAFSMNRLVDQDVYPDDVSRRVASVLTHGSLCFEARNAMPAVMRDAFQRAVLEYLSGQGRLEPILEELDSVRLALQSEPWPARDPNFSCTGTVEP